MRFSPADSPIGGEQEQAVALHVLDGLGVAGEVEVTQDVSVGVVLDPAQLLEGELLHPDLDVVLGVQTVLQYFQLQHADDADHDFFHAAAHFAEDLDSALLSDLLHAFHELLALHGVLLLDAGKVFGGEGGDAGELDLLLAGTQGVADGEDARVEQADDVAS